MSLKLYIYLPFLCVASLIFYLSSQSNLPIKPIFEFQDKVMHFLAFFTLGYTCIRIFLYKKNSRIKSALITIFVCTCYGLSDELHQLMVPNRVFDLANSEVSIREKCGLLSYSPLAGGRLSGKYINGKQSNNSRYVLWPQRFNRNNTKRGENAIKKYVNLAKKYNIKPSTFANAFVLSRPFLTSNIIGATTLSHLEENINSLNINFTEEMINDVEDIHLSDPNPCV